MKILKTIGGIVVWLIAASVVATIATKILNWLAMAFKIDTAFGFVIFLLLTMPEVFCIMFWICMFIGYFFITGKKSAIVTLIVCSLLQGVTLFAGPSSITTWVATAATIIGFGVVCSTYFGNSNVERDVNNG